MEALTIKFIKSDKEFEKLLVDIFGESIKKKIIEPKHFDGDILNIVATLIIPVTTPFLAVLFQNYIQKKKKTSDTTKKVAFKWDGKEIIFENYDLEEMGNIMKQLSNRKQD